MVAQRAVLSNGSTVDLSRTTVGHRQERLLSTTLPRKNPVYHEGSVKIEGRLIANLRFVDDIVINTGGEESQVKVEIGPDMRRYSSTFKNLTLL